MRHHLSTATSAFAFQSSYGGLSLSQGADVTVGMLSSQEEGENAPPGGDMRMNKLQVPTDRYPQGGEGPYPPAPTAGTRETLKLRESPQTAPH